MTGDLIDQYLARLRAGLRASPERAGQILAEAEDHLRSSAAAGLVSGMSERDAQEAAIAAFGGVRAVVRAHRRPAGAVVAELFLAAMRLAAVYLLAVSAIGLFGPVLERVVIELIAPGVKFAPVPAGYARTYGVLAVSAAVGLVLLAGYWVARRRRARGGRSPGGLSPGPLFGGYFPLVAMICMLAVGVVVIPLLRMVAFPGETIASAPGVPAGASFGAVAVAIGYAARMAWILLRRTDTGERVPHAR